MESAAEALGVKLVPVEVRSSDDFEGAFAKIVSARSDALFLSADTLILNNREALVDLAARHKVPTIYPIRDFAAHGGLASYGTNYPDAYGQVGDYLGRVLNGEKPETLPVLQVTTLQLVINLKTVALGKARERRIRDESVKLLKEVQPVKVRPGQSLAGRPVASVASRRATGGCEAYTARKQAARVQLRHLIMIATSTPSV